MNRVFKKQPGDDDGGRTQRNVAQLIPRGRAASVQMPHNAKQHSASPFAFFADSLGTVRKSFVVLALIAVGQISGGVALAADPSGVDLKEFWRPGPSSPGKLSENRLFPEGRKFLFSFYSVGGGASAARPLPEEEKQQIFADYRKSGFEIIGPQYELNDRTLNDAEAHGFQVVYPIALPKKEVRESKELTEQEIHRRVAEQVRAVADDPRVILWDLKPEELRPWRKREMAYLAAAAKAIRAADLLKRPIYHYSPGHFSAAMLEAIAPHVDILGKGMYVNYSSQKAHRIWCKWTIDQEIKAIQESGSSAVPIAVSEMFQQPAEDELHLIPAWVRHDIYLSLVSGAKGVLVFSLRKRDDFNAWQAYYDAYKQVGSELLENEKLAQIFLYGEHRANLAIEITNGPETVEMVFQPAKVETPIRYPVIHFSDIVYEGNRYLVAVNSATKPVEAMISGFPYDSARALPLFGESREPFNIGEGEFAVTFAPLEVKAWKFSRK